MKLYKGFTKSVKFTLTIELSYHWSQSWIIVQAKTYHPIFYANTTECKLINVLSKTINHQLTDCRF